MPTTAKIVADSISKSGQRITTMVLEYPRIIHSEFMTHRMFSRNASSSRAIPVEKQIERIKNDPFVPTYWGANQKGMQASEELSDSGKVYAKEEWLEARDNALHSADHLMYSKVHKQLANRLLEPFSHIQVVVTATEWKNFFAQRLHPAAQPEIQELAKVMKEAMKNSTPKVLTQGFWHLPFIETKDRLIVEDFFSDEDLDSQLFLSNQRLLKISVARCARVSYGLNERGWGDIEKDLALYDMLFTSGHWSPFEHQACSMNHSEFTGNDWENGTTHMDRKGSYWSGNFKGWIQNRQFLQPC